MSSAIDKLKNLTNIKKRLVLLPVSRKRAMVKPLTVADDLTLRTIITSPDIYDKELAKLIYKHVELVDDETDKPKQTTFAAFCDAIADIDRKVLIWGLYDVTYKSIGKQAITCPSCKEKFDDEISSDQVIHPDFATFWDIDTPYKDYRFPVTINVPEVEMDRIVFNTKLPSINDHIEVLKFISQATLKDNFDKFNTILSKSEELTLITDSIHIYDTVDGEPDIISDRQEIYQAIKNFITFDDTRDVVTAYNKEFNKFNPTFKKEYTCSSCSHEFDFFIDFEILFFQSFLGV
ncbi:MAG: hypothetical protein DRG78_12490 [Epsilonproteobacteria bacterium]|nr:MAG: hypothetical protein DRG78_12490 [Campylobacterota bacterium]